MNQIFKTKRNKLGQSVVTSELAKSKGKSVTLASVLLSSFLSMGAMATPVSIQGTATSENAVSIGSDSFATAVDGVATGKSSVATGQGFSRDDFAVKVAENKAAVDAVNGKQDELNNANNQLDAANNAIGDLTKQIDDLTKQQEAIADKIQQRDALLPTQKDAQDKVNADTDALNDAKTALDNISTNGKNLYLNFTDVLNTLNWSALNGADSGRNTVANELQSKIESNFTDFAGRYTKQDYRDIVDGYINRQASYQGSYEYFNSVHNRKGDGIIGGFINNNILFNRLFFNSALNSTDYVQDYVLTNTKGRELTIQEVGYTYKLSDGDYINNQGRLSGFVYQKTWNLPDSSNLLRPDNSHGISYTEESLNTFVLIDESLKKSSSNKTLNLLNKYMYSSQGDYRLTFIKDDVNIDSLNKKYNQSVHNNYSDINRILFGLKGVASDTTKINMLNYDKNIEILTKLKDFTVSNQNLITLNDITRFKSWLQEIHDYDASIDWNFDKSAINLTDYRANLNKVIAYNNKINTILDLYQSIIDERKKSNADIAKIERETQQLMALKNEVIEGTNDMTNFIAGITPTYNKEWADYYLNYGKTEADAMIARINSELKLYNDKDELIVEATTKAKELQKAYDDAKKKLKEDQAKLDKINDELNDLELTDTEKATDDVKKAKEDEKVAAEAEKERLEDEIKKGTEELDKLKEDLANTSLKDLGLRSQAHGSNAFASGDDSIAMGTNATVTSNDGIAIGRDTNVTGKQSIAIGAENTVTGDKSIAIGVGHTVSGNRSSTIGDPNVISGDDVFVAGNNNNVASNNVMVMGNNITVGTGFNGAVVLGANSTVESANPTSSVEIRGTTYNFAGTNPTSTVSVGAEGEERQIVNVAAGRITETSTDAINGSQLYAVIGAVNQITASVNPDVISDMINDEAGWKVVTTSSEGGNVSGNALTDVNNGDTVTIDAGKNINITQTGQTISIATSDTPTFNNITINEAPTEGNHAATKDYVDNGRSVVEAGDNVKVEAKTDGATGKTTYTVSADVPNVTVTGGNNVNITTNVDDTTGDITYSIDIPNVTVEGGKNVTVNTATNDKGDITYTVDVNVDTLTTNVTAGDNVVVKEVVDTDGNKTYTLSADKTTVSSGNGIAVTSTTSTTENGATITNYEVALTDDLKAQIAKEESVTTGSKNVTVTQDGTNDTGGKNFIVDLAKNLNLTPEGSLTIGDVVITGDAINTGGNKITNVANGTNPTDAVNLSQLNASKSMVEAGDKAKVERKTNADGSTTYTVTALTTEVKGGTNANVTESVGDKGQSVYTVDVKGDLAEINSITNGGSTIKLGDANVSVEGAKITNVANGTNPMDAVNVSQLNAAKTEVKAGENVKVAETTGANGQSVYTVSATGDLTNITSISNGDTKVSLGDGIVNVEGNRITNVASPVEAGDAVNKDYVDNSHSTVSSTDGTISVVKSVVNATTGAVNYDLAVKGGIKVATDDGKVVEHKLGDTLTVTGDNKNISTVTTSTGATQVKLADDVKVNSVTTGNVSISTEGVNAGGKKVTNVAPAEISPTSTDAVNGSQLYATNRQVINNANNIAQLGDNVQNLNRRVDNLDGKINRVNKEARAGIAGAVATASLPQVYIHGKSMVSAATGHYKNENAIAVGYSRASDNGKLVFKLNSSANTRGDFTIGTGIGYQW
ncbi:YadA-like family protein [Pelistega suis]|uniref:YadA-like family protein n=1 Tax=Pelistega suis TaxID=1631957 RepID=UPI00211B841A|nr:YadA-like family protein [Pelistega suis]MCQ9328420.1 YadA-like family protein [Pelistega suis]